MAGHKPTVLPNKAFSLTESAGTETHDQESVRRGSKQATQSMSSADGMPR